MAGKGRRKTEMKLIDKKAARSICFSKRRVGLFKKVKELSILTGAHVGALAFSPAGKLMVKTFPVPDTLIGAQAQIFSRSSCAQPEANWESLFFRAMALGDQTASLWWEAADLETMGVEEVERFEKALLFHRAKEVMDEVASAASGNVMVSSFSPSIGEWIMNENAPPSFFADESLVSSQLSDAVTEIPFMNSSSEQQQGNDAFLDIPRSISSDSMHSSFTSLPWNEAREQRQWKDDSTFAEANPSFCSNASFFSGWPSDNATSFATLPWGELPEQQHWTDAGFTSSNLWTPSSLASDASFFSGGAQPVEGMDTSLTTLLSDEPFEQPEQWIDNWSISFTPADDFQGLEPSFQQLPGHPDLPPLTETAGSGMPLASVQAFEQLQLADGWPMNASFADGFQEQEPSFEQLDLSYDLAPLPLHLSLGFF